MYPFGSFIEEVGIRKISEEEDVHDSMNNSSHRIEEGQEELKTTPSLEIDFAKYKELRETVRLVLEKGENKKFSDDEVSSFINDLENKNTDNPLVLKYNKEYLNWAKEVITKNPSLFEPTKSTASKYFEKGGRALMDLVLKLGPIALGLGIGVLFLNKLAEEMSGCYCDCPDNVGSQISNNCNPDCYVDNTPSTNCTTCNCKEIEQQVKAGKCDFVLSGSCGDTTKSCQCYWRKYTALTLFTTLGKDLINLGGEAVYDVSSFLKSAGKYIIIAIAIGIGIFVLNTFIGLMSKKTN